MPSINPYDDASEALRKHVESLRASSISESALAAARGVATINAQRDLNFISERVRQSLGVAGAAQHLHSSFGPTGMFQRMAEDAINNARFHQSIETMTAWIAAASRPLDVTRELLRSFEPPQSSIQRMIESAQAAMTRGAVTEIFSRVQAAASASLSDQRTISETIQRVAANNHLWQSQRTADFFARLVREPTFRSAVEGEFETEEQEGTQASASAPSVEAVLDAVENGLAQAVDNPSAISAEDAVRNMFSLWRALPNDLRSLVIGVIGSLIASYLYQCLQLTNRASTVPSAPQQQIRVIQRNVQTIIIYRGLPVEVEKQLRIVTRNELPIFTANRRDSSRIATLPIGKVVSVLSRHKHWTKIAWSNSDDVTHVGWDQTRYLRKIGRPPGARQRRQARKR